MEMFIEILKEIRRNRIKKTGQEKSKITERTEKFADLTMPASSLRFLATVLSFNPVLQPEGLTTWRVQS